MEKACHSISRLLNPIPTACSKPKTHSLSLGTYSCPCSNVRASKKDEVSQVLLHFPNITNVTSLSILSQLSFTCLSPLLFKTKLYECDTICTLLSYSFVFNFNLRAFGGVTKENQCKHNMAFFFIKLNLCFLWFYVESALAMLR